MKIKSSDILKGKRRSLSKAITLLESSHEDHKKEASLLLNEVLPHSGKSIRIGISGVPGVGKSTFIEAFGNHLIKLGKKVAVLAVDPSSPVSGGSILGDKTRMESLSREENAFIRPSPTVGAFGGVAHATRESMFLCEAAGFDIILVETVGVGQSEYEVSSMIDFFLVLMLPNAGDELQGIKKGILELADLIVINKADGEMKNLAQKAAHQYQSALAMIEKDQDSPIKVLCSSSTLPEGLGPIWSSIESDIQKDQQSGQFFKNRQEQNMAWLKKLIHYLVDEKIQKDDHIEEFLNKNNVLIKEGKISPLSAAQKVIQLLLKTK